MGDERPPGKHEQFAIAYTPTDARAIQKARQQDRLDMEKERMVLEQRIAELELELRGLETKQHYRERGATKTRHVPLNLFVLSMWEEIATLPKRAACERVWKAIKALPEPWQRKLLPDMSKEHDEMKRRVRRAYKTIADLQASVAVLRSAENSHI